MSAASPFTPIANGGSLPWSELPEWPADELVPLIAQELERGARLSAWFGVPDPAGVRLAAVLAYDAAGTLAAARSRPFTGAFPALTVSQPQAHLFEREIHEQHGLVPESHPWLKPVRRSAGEAPEAPNFYRVDGQEIHEVAVGPIHAGIIEPGHFRFQCSGEEVWHLEIALGYQHRGVEEALIGGPHRASLAQVEAVSGDATTGHTVAYSLVLEALAGAAAPPRAQWLRAIAGELGRLANHTGDLGALAGDVAFQPTAAACGKIRGDFRNLTALICGNRFGRWLIRPGGCVGDLEPARAAQLAEKLESALADAERVTDWLWNARSVRARFERTGAVSSTAATVFGLVGPPARACGLGRDVRHNHPAGWYRNSHPSLATSTGGDVQARARVRGMEIKRSGQWIREQLASAPPGEIFQALPPSAPDRFAVALVEGWRGETCHAAVTDPAGRFRRYKIVDPSFHNWTGLALALRGQAISDFPLCNKSFNLCYSGFDL